MVFSVLVHGAKRRGEGEVLLMTTIVGLAGCVPSGRRPLGSTQTWAIDSLGQREKSLVSDRSVIKASIDPFLADHVPGGPQRGCTSVTKMPYFSLLLRVLLPRRRQKNSD